MNKHVSSSVSCAGRIWKHEVIIDFLIDYIICDCIFDHIICDCIFDYIICDCIFDYIIFDCIFNYMIIYCIFNYIICDCIVILSYKGPIWTYIWDSPYLKDVWCLWNFTVIFSISYTIKITIRHIKKSILKNFNTPYWIIRPIYLYLFKTVISKVNFNLSLNT